MPNEMTAPFVNRFRKTSIAVVPWHVDNNVFGYAIGCLIMPNSRKWHMTYRIDEI